MSNTPTHDELEQFAKEAAQLGGQIARLELLIELRNHFEQCAAETKSQTDKRLYKAVTNYLEGLN